MPGTEIRDSLHPNIVAFEAKKDFDSLLEQIGAIDVNYLFEAELFEIIERLEVFLITVWNESLLKTKDLSVLTEKLCKTLDQLKLEEAESADENEIAENYSTFDEAELNSILILDEVISMLEVLEKRLLNELMRRSQNLNFDFEIYQRILRELIVGQGEGPQGSRLRIVYPSGIAWGMFSLRKRE